MNRKSIIFDFDGILIDNTERDYQSFYYVFKKYKMNILNKEEVMEMRKKRCLSWRYYPKSYFNFKLRVKTRRPSKNRSSRTAEIFRK